MKKTLAILLSFLIITMAFTGCGNTTKTKSDKFSVVTTIYPIYDWVKEIIGNNTEKAELSMLLDNGVDLHSFQPTADDIINISTCDLFIYVGGESDAWVDEALKESVNKDMVVINLLDILGDSIKEEEIVEGMEANLEKKSEDGVPEYDEHVWLSLNNAKLFCEKIADALEQIHPEAKNLYSKNLADYTAKLTALDKSYSEAVSNASQKTILFGDRFPFRYLVDDYGLSYYAAFVGCSAESEASFETVKFLASKVDELKLSTVLTLDGSNQKIAKTIVSSTQNKNAKILSLDSMQAVTTQDIQSGATYITLMEKNLEVLKEALK